MEIEGHSLKLLHPFSLIISGVSQSGKSEFVKKLLTHDAQLIEPCPSRIIVSYTENQPANTPYDDMAKHNNRIEFRQGLDFDMSEFSNKHPTLLIIDDQMKDVLTNEKIQTLFTRGIHHNSVSVILLTQNLYPQGKFGRDIRLNCHYMVIMRSPTFASQIQYLGKQFFHIIRNFYLMPIKEQLSNHTRTYSSIYTLSVTTEPECSREFFQTSQNTCTYQNEVRY